jgi:cytochrome b6-f complex subunit 7
MSAEIFNTAILSITLTMVGLGLGFLFLKIQGKAE